VAVATGKRQRQEHGGPLPLERGRGRSMAGQAGALVAWFYQGQKTGLCEETAREFQGEGWCVRVGA